MLVLLGGIFLLHVATVILLLTATIENAWWTTGFMNTDIWTRWIWNGAQWNQTALPNTYPEDYLQAVQACSILACVFSGIGLFVFLAQLFTLPKGKRFILSGVFQLLACLFIMIAATIYTDIFHRNDHGSYGPSFIIAWLAFALTFISCVIYFILRKKTT
ncbi:hypothetical protein QTP70_031805 [Hemibagrus guttatus]|uniref:Epithelial membrane protein 1 n=1 Tax=Hemibagrus guttatus TaxID=175788 RepID=A0AAE0UK84_9TELE|nr:hypothetical protein QTP70_031805 [Hemibagrus guttatus]KAK3525474.1 hypothetical protein QTP86_032020 [Hemibagrus guttatus]